MLSKSLFCVLSIVNVSVMSAKTQAACPPDTFDGYTSRNHDIRQELDAIDSEVADIDVAIEALFDDNAALSKQQPYPRIQIELNNQEINRLSDRATDLREQSARLSRQVTRFGGNASDYDDDGFADSF